MNTDIPKELEEKYEIKEKIGEGGMGRVFKVRHRALQRFDVCKVIQSRIFLNDDQKKKFIREARISSNLKKHKNIVQVYGAGGEDETPFILFEYVKGTTLESRIKEAVRLPTKEALFYAKEICEGLSYAHSMGIVHRDMKSENVILSDQIEDGFPVPKIADFGIATVKGEPPKQQKSEWSLHGTPSYMSPEQAAGEEATEQSDIYSVGIIMYEMLTGAVPFKGQSLHQVIMQHINEPPKPIHEVNPEVPIQVSELVHKAIEKKAGDRYASAEEFAGRLEKAMSLADRWLKGGGSKGAATTSSMRRATTSFSSFPRTGSSTNALAASTQRFNVPSRIGRAEQPTPPGGQAAPGTQGPPDLAGLLLEYWSRYQIQIIVAAAGFLVIFLYLAFRLFLSGGGFKSNLAYTPKDLRICQGVKDAVVNWKSDAAYMSAVEYGLELAKMTQERGAGVEELDHSVKLSGLKPGTKYHYRVIYPSGDKSLPYSFTFLEPDFRFWMTPMDRGVRVEGETTVPARAVLFWEKDGNELKLASQEGDSFESSHTFKIEGMRSDVDRIKRVHLSFATGEETDIGGDKVRMR